MSTNLQMVSVVLWFSGEAGVNRHEKAGDRYVARAQSVPVSAETKLVYKYSETDQSALVDYNRKSLNSN